MLTTQFISLNLSCKRVCKPTQLANPYVISPPPSLIIMSCSPRFSCLCRGLFMCGQRIILGTGKLEKKGAVVLFYTSFRVSQGE